MRKAQNPQKTWNKFLAKLALFETLNKRDWNHYQLLGYILSKISLKIEPEGKNELPGPDYKYVTHVEPNRHGWLELMRHVYKDLNKDINECLYFIDMHCLKFFGKDFNIMSIRTHLKSYLKK
jgi:hypothetical protein